MPMSKDEKTEPRTALWCQHCRIPWDIKVVPAGTVMPGPTASLYQDPAVCPRCGHTVTPADPPQLEDVAQ